MKYHVQEIIGGRSIRILLCIALTGAAATPMLAVPTLTAPGVLYTQDFDTLASSGTSGTLPDGWSFAETGTAANETYAAGTGSSGTGNTYSFGAATSTERAFGGLRSSSVASVFGVQLLNGTGQSINSLSVSFTGEQWRLGAEGGVDELSFEYSVDATSVTTGTWTGVGALDFLTPNAAGTAGARDGNSAANRTALSAMIEGLAINSGATFWFRWVDLDTSGSDDGLAIDDFSVAGQPSAAAAVPDGGATVGLLSLGFIGLTGLRRRFIR